MTILLRKLARISLLTVLMMAVSPLAWTSETPSPSPAHPTELLILQQKLQDDTDSLEFSRNLLENMKKTPDSTQLEEASYNVDLAEVQLQKIELELASAHKNIPLLESYLDHYEQQLINARARKAETVAFELQERVSIERQKLVIEKQRIKQLTQLKSLAIEILSLEKDRLNQLTEKIRLEEVAKLRKEQQADEQKLATLQQAWELKLQSSREALDALRPIQSPPSAEQQLLQEQITEAQENMQLTEIQLTLSRIDTLLSVFTQRDFSQVPPARQAEMSERLEKLKEELQAKKMMVENHLSLFDRQLNLLKQPGARHVLSKESKNRLTLMYSQLSDAYLQTQTLIQDLSARLTKLQSAVQKGAGQTWRSRQMLPKNWEDWKQFGADLWTLPQMAIQSLRSGYDQLVENLSKASGFIWIALFALIPAWVMLCLWIKRFLSGFLGRARDKGISFSANAFTIVAQIVYRNIPGIIFFGTIFILLLLLRVSANNMVVVTSVAAVWFFYSVMTGLARISLFENIWDLSGSDVKLYQGLRWSLGLGSFIIALTVLSHFLPLPANIVASFDRLFMLVLLGVSLPLLRSWRVLPGLIAKEGKTKPYVRRISHLLGFLIPFSLFSNAVIGLIGYVNLAWIIWIAEVQFLLVLTALMLARGLLGDTMEFLAKQAIRKLKSGWVWTESILKPLHTVLQLIFIFTAGYVLFHLYGLNQHPLVVERLNALVTNPIIQWGGVSITAYNIFQFAILLMVIRWAAKWSREFAYRFIFAKYKDKGLRNSMAVFTQYATIMAGAFVILKVIGIDLTTLTVVLGALAVGIGFGLQGIANNMVSGILLLIERPFRAGDIITLGTHEGEVTHIGVRATTIKTWDNMDVIIPNAETVSQALTNWTHHDSIVRTTFDLNIAHQENPYQAQAIIMQVLRRHPAVVSFPEPSVLFSEFAAYSLKFQVRYFIDLSLGKSRIEIRSEILFAIWDSLRAAGIEIPYPQQNINIISPKE